ncbi:MAG: sulfurtransferase TusA family protein [Clostridia bacterium]|nr:sulfurtransferase TusA family protein [Clostridia bacterium]NCC76801.1 sulfurtransferase TusA family protein [Clostridia bacterium]
MIVLDCLGDFCPVPLISAKEKVKNLQPGDSLMVVTDHSCVLESLRDYFSDRDYGIAVDEVLNGVWEVTISRKLKPQPEGQI